MGKKYNYTEKALSEYAKKASQSIVIRSWENGNSKDERRDATEAEARQVENAIAAALISIKNGYDAASAKATAGFFVIHNSGETHINTYDSVYIPINEFLREFEIEKAAEQKSHRIEELLNVVSEIEPSKNLTVTEGYKVEAAKIIVQEKGWPGSESDIKIAQALLIQGYERHQIHQAINSLSPETAGKAQLEMTKYAQGITEKAMTPEIKQQIQDRAKGNSLER